MNTRQLAITASGFAALSALCAPVAHAQIQAEDGTAEPIVAAAVDAPDADGRLETYQRAYFDAFQPVNALDMVRQVPGFSLESGGSARGFGEANTNFLVNGRRPSTKSQSAGDILSRIPAATVKRIELLDGASLDIPGLSGQVVNIVARAVELSGSWEYAARFEEGTEPQLLDAEITLSGTRGDLGFSVGFESGQFTFSEDSVETFRGPDGTLIEDRTEDVFLRNTSPEATLNLTWTPSAGPMEGHVANLNASVALDNDNTGVREVFTALDSSRRSGQSVADIGEDELEIEIGGDYAVPLSLAGLDGTLKLIGLFRNEDGDGGTIFVNAFEGESPTRRAFLEDYEGGEAIGRVEYAFKAGENHDVQISGEYAYNFLASETVFESEGVALETDFVRVEEDRFDFRLTDSWQVSDDLSVQLSAGAEYSTLQVVDPRSEARNFFRPKGFASASYQLDDRYALRGRVERGVGQLNFGTFVDGRNLADEIVTSGNAEIKPDQFWEASVTLERNDDRLLSGSITPFIRRIEDPIDRVLFPDGTEGPGNLDSALRYGVDANATLLMDTLGVPGLRFELEGGLSDSEIDDPLTGERRQINFNNEYYYEIGARYDIPGTDIALTTEIENDQSSPFFRLDEIREVVVDDPYLSFGVIHKDLFGLQVTVRATNLLNNSIIQTRDRFFGDDLRLGPLTRTERFARDRGRRLSIEITDTF
ncbi:MAG: TonB-dependent receptor [Litorimonas sp.]